MDIQTAEIEKKGAVAIRPSRRPDAGAAAETRGYVDKLQNYYGSPFVEFLCTNLRRSPTDINWHALWNGVSSPCGRDRLPSSAVEYLQTATWAVICLKRRPRKYRSPDQSALRASRYQLYEAMKLRVPRTYAESDAILTNQRSYEHVATTFPSQPTQFPAWFQTGDYDVPPTRRTATPYVTVTVVFSTCYIPTFESEKKFKVRILLKPRRNTHVSLTKWYINAYVTY